MSRRSITGWMTEEAILITGDLKSKIDAEWNDFWAGGIPNPMEVADQLAYLLFINGLDQRQTLAENKANRTGEAGPGDG